MAIRGNILFLSGKQYRLYLNADTDLYPLMLAANSMSTGPIIVIDKWAVYEADDTLNSLWENEYSAMAFIANKSGWYYTEVALAIENIKRD